jgi:hypothetical protein
MNTKKHIIYGVLFTSIFSILLNLNLLEYLILFLSTWLFIDLDHVLRYFIKTRNLNPKKFFEAHHKLNENWLKLSKKQKQKYKLPVFIFHNLETLFLIFLLSQLIPIFYLVLMGFLFHMILDYLEIIAHKDPIILKLSLIGLVFYNKKRIKFNQDF